VELTRQSATSASCAACYALCRPPGHHAGRSTFGGLCYLNSAAAAAEHLSRVNGGSRVAMMDIGFHHGNGSQDIFYSRSDVLFVSIHADPNKEFPYFSGYPTEEGEGAGQGYNLNVTLPVDPHVPGHGVTSEQYMAALQQAISRIASFEAQWLVISAGTDICENDPVGGFLLHPEDFTKIGEKLSQLGLPTLVVQEGGYDLCCLGDCVVNLLLPFAARQGQHNVVDDGDNTLPTTAASGSAHADAVQARGLNPNNQGPKRHKIDADAYAPTGALE